MPELLGSAALAFLGYSIMNISQATQKIGLHILQRSRIKGLSLWTLALLGSGVSFVIVFGALAIGRVSLVGAMAGTGLVSLSVFSWIVMGEDIGIHKIGAIAAILIGAVLVALFSVPGEESVRPQLLWGIPIGVVVLFLPMWAAMRAGPILGISLGAFAGFLGSYSQLFQREVATAVPLDSSLLEIIRHVIHNPINLVWIGLAFVSMVVLQFAYRHTQATRIIPAFTGVFIITPVLGGVIVFQETLTPLQWVGVVVILLGTLQMTRRRAETA